MLKFVAIILLCIACVSFIVKGEEYNEKFTLEYFLRQLSNEDIPDIFTPVRNWFEDAQGELDKIEHVAPLYEIASAIRWLGQSIVYGAILPIQAVIFMWYFLKIWFV